MINETQQERLICTQHQGKTITIPVQKTFKEYRTKIKNELNLIFKTVVYFENMKKEKIEIQTPKDYQQFLADNPNLSPIQATIELASKVEKKLIQYYENHDKTNSTVEIEADSVPITICDNQSNREQIKNFQDLAELIQEKPQKQSQRPIDEEGEGENIENIEGTESKLILLPPQRVGVKNTKNLKKKY